MAEYRVYDLETASAESHIEAFHNPPRGITVQDYGTYVLQIHNSLYQRFHINITDVALLAALLTFLPVPTQEYIRRKEITEYKKALDVAIYIEIAEINILQNL
jgi:hypothetical protein